MKNLNWRRKLQGWQGFRSRELAKIGVDSMKMDEMMWAEDWVLD
jgi:hypothetical protein